VRIILLGDNTGGCHAAVDTFSRSCVLEYEFLLDSFVFFKEIYCTDSIYSAYKGKLQNCSCNQFE